MLDFDATQKVIRDLCGTVRTFLNLKGGPVLTQTRNLALDVRTKTVPKANTALVDVHDILKKVKPIIPKVDAGVGHGSDLLGRLNAGATVEFSIPRDGGKPPFVFSVRVKPDEE